MALNEKVRPEGETLFDIEKKVREEKAVSKKEKSVLGMLSQETQKVDGPMLWRWLRICI